MTEKWYMAKFGKIEEVDIDGETSKYVYISGTTFKSIKESDWRWFSKDRDEAKSMMIKKYKGDLEELKKQVKLAEERLCKAMEA